MITIETIRQYFKTRASASKQWTLSRSTSIAQVILLSLVLMVIYTVVKPCECGEIDAKLTEDAAHQAVWEARDASGAWARPIPTQHEDEVIEDGTVTALVGVTEELVWRWDDRPHREVVTGWGSKTRAHQSAAFSYQLGVLDGEGGEQAPRLLVLPRNAVTARNQAPQTFLAREINESSRTLGLEFELEYVVDDDVAYLAYYPKEQGIGVEVYAVDLRHNSPLWRTTVRAVDAHADLRTQVQLHVASKRLHVMTKEGDLRRIDELDVRSGEIINMQEVSGKLTQAPPREALFQDSFKHCVFIQAAHDDVVECVPAREETNKPLQVVREGVTGETIWRLSLLGDRIIFAPLERLWPEPTSDIILSHDSKKSGSVVTAIDHKTGEVLWTTGVQGLSSKDVKHKHVEVDLMRVGEEPALIVYTEEDSGACATYLDPHHGKLLSVVRFAR